MPKQIILLPEKYERAVSELEESPVNQLTARSLTRNELNRVGKQRNFTKGWRIPFGFSHGEKEFDLLLTANFPFEPPVVALADPPPPLTYPHIEDDGILCLLPDSANVSSYQPVGVMWDLLTDAVNLVDDCLSFRNQEDFRREFHSYWNRFLSDGKTKFISLLDPKPLSRAVSVWRGNGIYVFGEDDLTLKTWLENSFGEKKYNLEPAVFLWLSQTMLPSEYPKTSRDVAGIAERNASGASSVLNGLTLKTPNEANVLLGSETETGICLAGVTVRKPQPHSSRYLPNVGNPLERGFRDGKISPQVLVDRYLQSPATVGRYEVERADAAWVHGRGQDARQPDLSATTVTIMGCGSVGSPVARLLAQSGVGTLRLIDPQILTRSNTGRHALGAKYVGRFKSESLAKELSENYPHMAVEHKTVRWEEAARSEPEIFTTSNLIISATGDWAAESALNEWQRKIDDFPPILYGWTESYACAGHAVAVFRREKGCLQCGMTDDGVPLYQAAQWKNQSILKQEPACGVMFQPYGPVELNHTITLIAELALDTVLGSAASGTHRVWACRRHLLESTGGVWTTEWLSEPTANAEGGITLSRIWKTRKSCEICGQEDSQRAPL